jgi:hypothetical protein
VIHVEDRVQVRPGPAEALLYLADFGRIAEWDPGIVRARRLDAGPLAAGARFDIVARFLGRDVPMAYELTRLDLEAGRAEVVGRADGVRAVDRITVTPRGAGSEVHWQADFEFSGAGRLLAPFSRPVFLRLARRAMDGLRRKLG